MINLKTMKKIFAVLLVMTFAFSQLSAQQPSFNKGDKVLGLSVGFPLLHGNHMVVPPVIASFEVGIVDGILKKASIGIGGYVGFSSSKWVTDKNYFNFHFGVKGAFHYPFVDKLDTYAGIITGYSVGAPGYGFDGGAFVGLRYYLSDSFALMAEAGYGVTFCQAGMAFKF
jgi:hypothetical protein